MTVAGFVVNGTGPDALAVRRWAIDALDQAIVGARRLEEEESDGN
jgi:hypothetical protein